MGICTLRFLGALPWLIVLVPLGLTSVMMWIAFRNGWSAKRAMLVLAVCGLGGAIIGQGSVAIEKACVERAITVYSVEPNMEERVRAEGYRQAVQGGMVGWIVSLAQLIAAAAGAALLRKRRPQPRYKPREIERNRTDTVEPAVEPTESRPDHATSTSVATGIASFPGCHGSGKITAASGRPKGELEQVIATLPSSDKIALLAFFDLLAKDSDFLMDACRVVGRKEMTANLNESYQERAIRDGHEFEVNEIVDRRERREPGTRAKIESGEMSLHTLIMTCPCSISLRGHAASDQHGETIARRTELIAHELAKQSKESPDDSVIWQAIGKDIHGFLVGFVALQRERGSELPREIVKALYGLVAFSCAHTGSAALMKEMEALVPLEVAERNEMLTEDTGTWHASVFGVDCELDDVAANGDPMLELQLSLSGAKSVTAHRNSAKQLNLAELYVETGEARDIEDGLKKILAQSLATSGMDPGSDPAEWQVVRGALSGNRKYIAILRRESTRRRL